MLAYDKFLSFISHQTGASKPVLNEHSSTASGHTPQLPWWPDGKESACNAGARGSIPRLGRSPGGGSGNPFQYSRLENSMDRGVWRDTVQGVAKSQT